MPKLSTSELSKVRALPERPLDFDSPPIGMFDSGVGGLTVARALIDLMPDEHLIYVGDTARGPYGPRNLDDVREIAFEITDWLVRAGVKLVVVACNTAAAAALDSLRREFTLPIVGVVEPGLRAAVRATTGQRIGLCGTTGTVASGTYDRTLRRLRPEAELVSVSCPRFVEFVERGVTSGTEITRLASDYLEPLRDARVDTLVLGCTHYPLLARVISDAVGRHVTLISSADETAFEVLDVCGRTGICRFPEPGAVSGSHRFLATADPGAFRELGRRFLGPEVASVMQVDLSIGPEATLTA